MNRTKTALGASLAIAIPGLIVGLLLLLIPVDLLLKLIFVIMGIITLLSSIPGFVAGIAAFSTAGGNLSLIVSAISAVVGFLMIFNHNGILMIVLGVYMILLPLLNVLLAKDHLVQLKAELPKLIIGLLLIILGPANALDILLRIAGWVIIVMSLFYSAVVFVGFRKKQNTVGARVFVDVNGDGTVDTVYIDTTGDGKPDTATPYKENK